MTPSTRRAFSVAVFARRQGRILLILHRRLGTWLPVGGEIEAGETPLEAAIRELREETGLSGRFSPLVGVDGTPPGLIGYEEHLAGSKGWHLNFVFVADVDTDQVVPNEEFGEFRWVSAMADLSCPKNVQQLGAIALGATSEALVDLARRWLLCFNTRNLDGLLSLYAEDAVHTSPKLRARRPETKGEIQGRPALREWWRDCFERLPALRYEERSLTASAEQVFMEYLRHHPGEETLAVAEVLRCQGGLIRSSLVYHG